MFCIQINRVKTREMYINKALKKKGDLDIVPEISLEGDLPGGKTHRFRDSSVVTLVVLLESFHRIHSLSV